MEQVLDPPKRQKKLGNYHPDRVGEKSRHALQQAFAEVAIDHAFMHPELMETVQQMIRADSWVESYGLYEQFEAAVPGSEEKITARTTELQNHRHDRMKF